MRISHGPSFVEAPLGASCVPCVHVCTHTRPHALCVCVCKRYWMLRHGYMHTHTPTHTYLAAWEACRRKLSSEDVSAVFVLWGAGMHALPIWFWGADARSGAPVAECDTVERGRRLRPPSAGPSARRCTSASPCRAYGNRARASTHPALMPPPLRACLRLRHGDFVQWSG